MRIRNIIVLIAITGFIAAGLAGIDLGWGTDRDSIRVIDSARAILSGHYQRSRSLGFPLHEAATALFFACGGLVAANLASLIVTTAGIVAALRMAQHVAPARVPLAAITLCTAPLLLVNASSAIDFGWSFAAGMALILAALRVQRDQTVPALAAFATAALAAMLLRPDNVLFAAAVTWALLWRHGPARYRIILAIAAAGLLAAGIFLALNGMHGLLTGVSTTRPLWARAARATIFASAALGPAGVLALMMLARHGNEAAPQGALLRRIAWLAWLLYVPRFAALPDQVDYLIVPTMFSLLLAVCVLPWRRAVTCAVLSALPAVITVSIFARDAETGALRLAISPQWGAEPQDWAARRFASYMGRPNMAAYVAARLPAPGAPATLEYDTYMPGYVSPAHDLVIGEGQLYRIVARGAGPASLATVPRAFFRTIFTCDALLGPGAGWRGWEAPVTNALTRSGTLQCRRTDQ
jgi:hypothetical protein